MASVGHSGHSSRARLPVRVRLAADLRHAVDSGDRFRGPGLTDRHAVHVARALTTRPGARGVRSHQRGNLEAHGQPHHDAARPSSRRRGLDLLIRHRGSRPRHDPDPHRPEHPRDLGSTSSRQPRPAGRRARRMSLPSSRPESSSSVICWLAWSFAAMPLQRPEQEFTHGFHLARRRLFARPHAGDGSQHLVAARRNRPP